MKTLPALCMSLLAASAVWADTIEVGDETYEDVYVEELEGQYRILLPDTGEAVTVSSKRTDVELTYKSEEPERGQLKAAWEKRATPREEESTAGGAESEPMVLTTQTLRKETGLADTARFETELLLWAQLPDGYRQRLYNATAQAAQSDARFDMARVRQLEQVQEENQAQINAEAARAQQVQQQAAQEIAVRERQAAEAAAAADAAAIRSRAGFFYLNDIDGAVRVGDDTVVVGDTFGLSPSRYRLGSYYWEDYAAMAAAAEAEAAAAAQVAAAETAAAAQRAEALQAEADAAAQQAEIIQREAADAQARAQAALAQMNQLEDALDSGYRLKLHFSPVTELDVTEGSGEATAPVAISSPVWRVLWGVSGPEKGSRNLLITVLDENGAPVRGVSDAEETYSRYMVLDGPGNYTVKVSGAGDSNLYVVAEEVTRADDSVPGHEKLEEKAE